MTTTEAGANAVGAKPQCYCGRYYPDDLCPCARLARDMRALEREERNSNPYYNRERI